MFIEPMKDRQILSEEMEYILFGEGEGPGDASAVLDLLRRCTPRELKLAEEVLKLFLMKQPEGL